MNSFVVSEMKSTRVLISQPQTKSGNLIFRTPPQSTTKKAHSQTHPSTIGKTRFYSIDSRRLYIQAKAPPAATFFHPFIPRHTEGELNNPLKPIYWRQLWVVIKDCVSKALFHSYTRITQSLSYRSHNDPLITVTIILDEPAKHHRLNLYWVIWVGHTFVVMH